MQHEIANLRIALVLYLFILFIYFFVFYFVSFCFSTYMVNKIDQFLNKIGS